MCNLCARECTRLKIEYASSHRTRNRKFYQIMLKHKIFIPYEFALLSKCDTKICITPKDIES